MNDKPDRLAHLERQMEAMLRRLETLEAGATGRNRVEGIRERQDEEEDSQGTVSISGSIRLGQRRLTARHRADLSEALAADPEVVARVFAALGSPFRVRLLRVLLEGPRTSQELQAELDVGPVGQLYHHLKELLAASLIAQRGRGVYAIREEIVMPIVMAFLVAPRLASGQSSRVTEDESKEEE